MNRDLITAGYQIYEYIIQVHFEKEITRDDLLGKIADVAFSKMIKKYGIDLMLTVAIVCVVNGMTKAQKLMDSISRLEDPTLTLEYAS